MPIDWNESVWSRHSVRAFSLTSLRIWPNISCHTTQCQPKSVEIRPLVSVRKSALLGSCCNDTKLFSANNSSRFETREIAEHVVADFHSVLTEHDSVKLYLRFADTKAQKQLKQQSQERRTWRSREYSYSVEHTPSPITGRVAGYSHISPNGSYQSPAGVGNNFTPATSVSPP